MLENCERGETLFPLAYNFPTPLLRIVSDFSNLVEMFGNVPTSLLGNGATKFVMNTFAYFRYVRRTSSRKCELLSCLCRQNHYIARYPAFAESDFCNIVHILSLQLSFHREGGGGVLYKNNTSLSNMYYNGVMHALQKLV